METPSKSVESILGMIESSQTAGDAINAVPDDWNLFLTGPDSDGHSCSILPRAMLGAPRRVYMRGLAMGRGESRLVAIRAAVTWLRERMPSDHRDPDA